MLGSANVKGSRKMARASFFREQATSRRISSSHNKSMTNLRKKLSRRRRGTKRKVHIKPGRKQWQEVHRICCPGIQKESVVPGMKSHSSEGEGTMGGTKPHNMGGQPRCLGAHFAASANRGWGLLETGAYCPRDCAGPTSKQHNPMWEKQECWRRQGHSHITSHTNISCFLPMLSELHVRVSCGLPEQDLWSIKVLQFTH